MVPQSMRLKTGAASGIMASMALSDAQPGEVAHIIQLAVAPVFLLSGVGVTLGVFTNRLSRIVDRARALEQQLAHDEQNPDLIKGLAVLARRARYINTSITLGTLSGLMVALTVVLLFTDALIRVRLATAIAITFVAAMLTLTAALLVFLIEVRFATATLRIGGHLS
jgi:hypothetical protein